MRFYKSLENLKTTHFYEFRVAQIVQQVFFDECFQKLTNKFFLANPSRRPRRPGDYVQDISLIDEILEFLQDDPKLREEHLFVPDPHIHGRGDDYQYDDLVGSEGCTICLEIESNVLKARWGPLLAFIIGETRKFPGSLVRETDAFYVVDEGKFLQGLDPGGAIADALDHLKWIQSRFMTCLVARQSVLKWPTICGVQRTDLGGANFSTIESSKFNL